MNHEVVEQARQAYQDRNYRGVIELLTQELGSSVPDGDAAHLLGNSYMKLGDLFQASQSYEHALEDSRFEKRGAVLTNLGKARVALGDLDGASEAFSRAVEDPAYDARYKAYAALGAVKSKLGSYKEAGVAYRKAALDPQNPSPISALTNLGSCFVELGRPADAIESFSTTLDFPMTAIERDMIYAQMGRAYVSMNRMEEALSSFEKALADGQYQLDYETQAAYNTAREVVEARRRAAAGSVSGETDDFLSMLDPLDPTGQSGALMPSPDQTGFFDISEEEMKQISRTQMKAERKHKRTGLKVFITLLVLLLLLALGAGYAYYRGLGYPTQEDTINNLFIENTRGEDVSDLWATSVDQEARDQAMREVAKSSIVSIDGIDRSMTTSSGYVTVTLQEGGSVHYAVDLVREGIGWKISNIKLDFASQDDSMDSGQVGGTTVQDNAAQGGQSSSAGTNSGTTNTAN